MSLARLQELMTMMAESTLRKVFIPWHGAGRRLNP
jgi:hypothetical protein